MLVEKEEAEQPVAYLMLLVNLCACAGARVRVHVRVRAMLLGACV